MLRSFAVVGVLAVAALALVIGIIAFNARSHQNHPFAGGPSQAGVPDHARVLAKMNGYEPAPLVGGSTGRPVKATESRPGPPGRIVSMGDTFTGGGGGGVAAAAPRPVATCSAGLLGSLLATLGGLLGGGGSGC